MTARPSDGPLTWNVTGLLSDVLGAERTYPVAGVQVDLGDDVRLARPIDGGVRLVRTNRGILAHAQLETALEAQCSRCLQDLTIMVHLDLREEYLPSLDIVTGKPLPTDDEPEALRLTDQHALDLETPVREAIWLSEPVAPLCRSDCPGLCIDCGGRLDDGDHDHPDADIDPRLEALRAFREPDA
jgi:Predicted metal-binding, possibly nucleic acid-binding protein